MGGHARSTLLILILIYLLYSPPIASASSSVPPTGTGTAADPYILTTPENLYWLSKTNSAWLSNFALGCDIVIQDCATWDGGSGFSPIGNSATPFNGVFEGRNFSITGLAINRPASDDVGFFGMMSSGAVVRDVTVSGADIVGKMRVGVVAGTASADAAITNCRASGTVGGNSYLGGLVGYTTSSARIDDSIAEVNVTSSSGGSVGGVVGINFGTIENCEASGVVLAGPTSASVGGLAGNSSGTVLGCRATGDVTGNGYVGGLVGNATPGSVIRDSSAAGTVQGNLEVGGLVGLAWSGIEISQSLSSGDVSGIENVGGLVGHNSGADVLRSFALGRVYAEFAAGGLVGLNSGGGLIGDCYATGPMRGITQIGGLVGLNQNGTILNSYAAGPNRGDMAGGLVGGTAGGSVVSNSFWDLDATGKSESAGGTGLGTEAMMTQEPFVGSGWDFTPLTGVWAIEEGATYPYLQWQSIPCAPTTFYSDADGDLSGDPAQILQACTLPAGFASNDGDCDDADASIHPGAEEIWYDGVDQNCDGASDFDRDGDGFDSNAFGGGDCDDVAVSIHPGAEEVWYDGVDQNCDGASDYDRDGDGFDSDAFGGGDCDDAAVSIHPGAEEVWYDGVDQNCDGASDFDRDGDGHDIAFNSGDDCDDNDGTIHPGVKETCGDGIDQDCSGAADDDPSCVPPADGVETNGGGGGCFLEVLR